MMLIHRWHGVVIPSPPARGTQQRPVWRIGPKVKGGSFRKLAKVGCGSRAVASRVECQVLSLLVVSNGFNHLRMIPEGCPFQCQHQCGTLINIGLCQLWSAENCWEQNIVLGTMFWLVVSKLLDFRSPAIELRKFPEKTNQSGINTPNQFCIDPCLYWWCTR